MAETFTLFWHGPFSQWHMQNFRVDGVLYNCAEQYMMAEKAKLFGDFFAEAQIMDSSDPREQKKLGREVKNFDKEVWDAYAKTAVFKANHAKFTQNPDLLEQLLATEGTTLVEASPRDRIWGIGLGPDNPLAHDRANWRGTNWLGEVLTDVRQRIVSDKAVDNYKIDVEGE